MIKTLDKPIVVNFLGGPGTGKSSCRSHLFAELKWRGINCEESYEYVKARVWEDALNAIQNQIYIFGKQHNQLFRLVGKVDVIVTDAPLFNNILYDKKNDELFRALVLREFNSFDNMNFYINRVKPYNPAGRTQTEEGARVIDKEAFETLKQYNVPFEMIDGGPSAASLIADKVIERLNSTLNV